jgi:hypothetical protein
MVCPLNPVMSLDQQIRSVLNDIALRLDSCLDEEGGTVLQRIAVMECRNALQKYSGLHDVGRCRKALERLPRELEATGFPADLLKPVSATCQEVVGILRKL